MLTISLYLFSLFLSYTDFKYFLVPNITLAALLALMLLFGYFENSITISSVVVALLTILFFVLLMVLDKKMVLGGGDIKYIALIALYFHPLLFAYFLIITGLVQTLFMISFKLLFQAKKVYMIPAIFCAVIITDLLNNFGVIPVKQV